MDNKYKKLFETVTLPNGVSLRNRFVLAPLAHTSSNDDGTTSDVEISYTEKRAKDVGLAINVVSNVNDIGKAFPGQPSVAHDSDIEDLKRLVTAMKKNSAKALVQIHYGGAQALPELTPNGNVVAPSPFSMKNFGQQREHHAKETTTEEIEQAIKDFSEATRRAIEAGFDGIEIHGVNHYLTHQFFSPYYNRREDKWGDHLRFPLAVIDEVLKIKETYANKDFIAGYRLSPEETESPGIPMERTEKLIKTITKRAIDYAYILIMDIHSQTREGKYEGEERLKSIHQWVDGRIPVIGIGSVFSADDALDAVESIDIELVALGRGILLDYNFVNKIEEGKEEEIISYFDPNREDRHVLPPSLWEQSNKGSYPLPRKDK